MPNLSADFIYVIRRINVSGKPPRVEACGSFRNEARAEAFIETTILAFPEHGSVAGRWWCRLNESSMAEYWLQTDAGWRSEQQPPAAPQQR